MQEKMQEMGKASPWIRKQIVKWARGIGLKWAYHLQDGKANPSPLQYKIAEKLIFSKVKQKLGLDKCRICITSAAPISRGTLEFFFSLGIPVCEAYGMSECSGPTTLSTPEDFNIGSAGVALPQTEIKLSEDGEILIKGRHVFLGYFKNKAATEETISQDGYLHSGDLGKIDDKGQLTITGRKKEIIITSGGENISPVMIESKILGIGEINQAVVIGDHRKYLTALLTLKPNCSANSSRKKIEEELEKINKSLARVQTIKKFTFIPGEFSIEGGELTPTMKLKRRVILEKYKTEIESMY
jgi:long-subunit acyl-CoA synthetase (AMP-forming)